MSQRSPSLTIVTHTVVSGSTVSVRSHSAQRVKRALSAGACLRSCPANEATAGGSADTSNQLAQTPQIEVVRDRVDIRNIGI